MINWLLKFYCFFFLFTFASSLYAREAINSIVATVNDRVITKTHHERFQRFTVFQLQEQSLPIPSVSDLQKQTLDQLILFQLQLQVAQQRGFSISDEDITQSIRGLAAQKGQSIRQYRDYLIDKGGDYAFLREHVHDTLLIQQIQNFHVRRSLDLTDREINDFLSSPVGKSLVSNQYKVAHLLISLSGSQSPDAKKALLDDVYRLRAKLHLSEDFCKAANTADFSYSRCKDLGWRTSDKLPAIFANQVFSLKVGDVHEPILTDKAIHLIKLIDKRDFDDNVINEYHIRHILVKTSLLQTNEDVKELMHNIYQRLLNGEKFGELAQIYSQDPSSSSQDGEILWEPLNYFIPELAEIVENASMNSILPPFQTRFGWHVLEVLGKRAVNRSDSLKRQIAVKYFYQIRYNEIVQAWYDKLREEAFIERFTNI